MTKREKAVVRTFVCEQLRDEPDLSTLTLGILKKRYLAHVRCESLTSEIKLFIKKVVEEELTKMQDDVDNGKEFEETRNPRKKRKREKENDEDPKEDEVESKAKKPCRQPSSSSESEDKENRKTKRAESEEDEQPKSGCDEEEREVKKISKKATGNHKQQISSEDSSDEEMTDAVKKVEASEDADSPEEEDVIKVNGANVAESKNNDVSAAQGDEKEGKDAESESGNGDDDDRSDSADDSSGDNRKVEKSSTEKKDEPESDSSSLPSLESEENDETENSDKKKNTEKDKGKESKGGKDDNTAVVKLKRYISLCGVRQNYKKLLSGCKSVRSQVAVLKKTLEDLGVQGRPSIKKCKKVQMKREQAQELAELDTSNIIASKGRPRGRRASAWQTKESPPSPANQRALDSSSDSDHEGKQRSGKRVTDWANLKGIISDDADSN